MKKFFAEFKEFAIKGNVVDMAVGVVIGAAFGKITTSLVNDVIMPLIGLLVGGIDLTTLNIVLNSAAVEEAGADPVLRSIGKEPEEPVEEEAPSPTSEELLTEIRDLLKDKQ